MIEKKKQVFEFEFPVLQIVLLSLADILGDGSVKPADLVRGPDWLIGFKGNELQRLTRRVKFHGEKLKTLYPAKYHNIQKRIFFLYKKYNKKRGKRVGH